MQLNNDKGNIVRIDQANYDTGRTVFTRFEGICLNGDGTVNKEFVSNFQEVEMMGIDYDILANQGETIENNLIKVFYENLKKDDFLISEDIQNWIHSNKPIRVFIDNIQSAKEMVLNPAYKNLYDEMLVKHEGFIFVDNINSTMYIDAIEQADLDIILPFVGVWIFIEDKL